MDDSELDKLHWLSLLKFTMKGFYEIVLATSTSGTRIGSLIVK